MSRVHMDPGISTINEEESTAPLSSQALAEHERQHAAFAAPRIHHAQRSGPRRSTIDMSMSDKSGSDGSKKPKLNKRALDITRRLSVSSAMFHQLQSLINMQGAGSNGGPDAKYENTYRTEPKDEERFIAREVSDIMDRALRQKLDDVEYSPAECAKLSTSLTRIIKTRIQENLDLPRYKIVVNVILGQNTGQDAQVASRCLWSEETDRCATSSYKSRSLFAVAIAHGVYLD